MLAFIKWNRFRRGRRAGTSRASSILYAFGAFVNPESRRFRYGSQQITAEEAVGIIDRSAFEAAAAFFPAREAAALCACGARCGCGIHEIRAYANKAVLLYTEGGARFCCADGSLAPVPAANVLRPGPELLYEVLNRASGYALYACEEQTAQAFLTKNGCRIGVAGLTPEGAPAPGGIRSLAIRVPCAGRAAADPLAAELARSPDNLLLVGAPGAGKTTLLKKLIHALASGAAGAYYRTAVIDTRGEFADFIAGTPELITADVVRFGDKAHSLETALRLFSPDVLVCDEIGSPEDARALLTGANAGVRVIASIHAGAPEELVRRPQFRPLAAYGVFGRVLFLSRGEAGRVTAVLPAEELPAAPAGAAC